MRVAAPLPGVIKSISVQPGQQVNVGDELLIIEAMKKMATTIIQP